MKQLLINYGQIGKQERLSALLDMLSESNNQLSTKQNKDTIKVLGIIGEVYQKEIFIVWKKVCKVLQKKISDDDSNTFLSLAENIGVLVQKAFQSGNQNISNEDEEELKIYWNQLLTLYFSQFLNAATSLTDKKKSIAAAMCLSISIQSAPQKIVQQDRINLCQLILKPIKKDNYAAETQLLDCLLSLIVACEEKFEDCCDFCAPFIIEQLAKEQNILIQNAINMSLNITNVNWQKRKICIDIIYTLSVLTPNYIQNYKEQCFELISSFKYDKIKNVREAAQVAITSLQDLPNIKSQKYVQTVSSDNLSSTSRNKQLLSSQKVIYYQQYYMAYKKNLQQEESTIKRNFSNSYLKNITNSDILNDISKYPIEEQKEEDDQNQSDQQIPDLIDLQQDKEEIDQALEKLQLLKQQDELQQKNTTLIQQEKQSSKNIINEFKNTSSKQLFFEHNENKRISTELNKQKLLLIFKKDYDRNTQAQSNIQLLSTPLREPSNPRKLLTERRVNTEYQQNSPKDVNEIKMLKNKNNLDQKNTDENKQMDQNKKKFYKKEQNSLLQFENTVQSRFNSNSKQQNIDNNLKQINQNIKKIKSDLKVYEELLSSGEKLSKENLSPQKYPQQNLQNGNESMDEREKSLPRNFNFSPSRNYLVENNTPQKKRKIFEPSPVRSNNSRQLNNYALKSNICVTSRSNNQNRGSFTQISNKSQNFIEKPKKGSRTNSPDYEMNFKPRSLSPTQTVYSQNNLNLQSQRQYQPTFQQQRNVERDSPIRLNNFDQQFSKQPDLQFDNQQYEREIIQLKERIKQLEYENQQLNLQIYERNLYVDEIEQQKDQLNKQMIETTNINENLLKQLNTLKTENQNITKQNQKIEQDLQYNNRQLNQQISDLKIQIEQLNIQQIDHVSYQSDFSLKQSQNLKQSNQNVQDGTPKQYINKKNMTKNVSPFTQEQFNNNTQKQKNKQGFYYTKPNIRDISPLQKTDITDMPKNVSQNQEQTAKFCQNSIFSFEAKDSNPRSNRHQQEHKGDNQNSGLGRNDSQTFKKYQTQKHEIMSSFSPENSFVPNSNFWKDQFMNEDSIKSKNQNENEISLNQLNKAILKVDKTINASTTHINQLQKSETLNNKERLIQSVENEKQINQRNTQAQLYNQNSEYQYETVEDKSKTERLKQLQDELKNKQQELKQQQMINKAYAEHQNSSSNKNNSQLQNHSSIQNYYSIQNSNSSQNQFQTVQKQQKSPYDTEQFGKERQTSQQKKRSLNPYQESKSQQKSEVQKINNNKEVYQTENLNQIFQFIQIIMYFHTKQLKPQKKTFSVFKQILI